MRKTRKIGLVFQLVWGLLLPGILVSSSPASDAKSRSVTCAGIEQTYLYYSPAEVAGHSRKGSPAPDRALPAVMLLHGAGDRAAHMVEAWERFAAKKKIILLAPELPREKKYEGAAPQVFRCVVEDAKQWVHIDPRRVYLFGNSMGGYLAYDAAMFESQYFAAVAVHAMRIADEYRWIVERAQRKMPIAIYIGDRDQYFSVDSVRKTRDLLRKAGFPVHYVEMINHDHDYYARSEEINDYAWKFLKENILPVSGN
jgi:poly(3-hydroxybutyrate) depolymerase